MMLQFSLTLPLLLAGLLAGSASAPEPSAASLAEPRLIEVGGRTNLLAPGGASLRTTELRIFAPRLVAVPESSVRLALWVEGDDAEAAQPYYRISLDGREYSRVRRTSYEIKLLARGLRPAVSSAGRP